MRKWAKRSLDFVDDHNDDDDDDDDCNLNDDYNDDDERGFLNLMLAETSFI